VAIFVSAAFCASVSIARTEDQELQSLNFLGRSPEDFFSYERMHIFETS